MSVSKLQWQHSHFLHASVDSVVQYGEDGWACSRSRATRCAKHSLRPRLRILSMLPRMQSDANCAATVHSIVKVRSMVVIPIQRCVCHVNAVSTDTCQCLSCGCRWLCSRSGHCVPITRHAAALECTAFICSVSSHFAVRLTLSRPCPAMNGEYHNGREGAFTHVRCLNAA